MPATIFVLIGALFMSIIFSNFELGLLIITCCSPYIFLEIREKIRDYQDQQYLNWLFEQGREEKEKKGDQN